MYWCESCMGPLLQTCLCLWISVPELTIFQQLSVNQTCRDPFIYVLRTAWVLWLNAQALRIMFLDCGSSLASAAFDMFPQGQRAVSIIKCQRFMGRFTSSSHWWCYSHMLLKNKTFPKRPISPMEYSRCRILHWFFLLLCLPFSCRSSQLMSQLYQCSFG